MGALVALMWLLEGVDQVSGHALDQFGLRSWDVADLPAMFVAPWLHFGWEHLASNTIPFFVFGFLILLAGFARWLVATLSSIVGSGLFAWLLTPPGAIIAGASGLVFGWFGYLLVRGLFTRKLGQVAIAGALLVVYGGVLWGVLPQDAAVSWQGHLGGLVGGVFAAWALHRRAPSPTRR